MGRTSFLFLFNILPATAWGQACHTLSRSIAIEVSTVHGSVFSGHQSEESNYLLVFLITPVPTQA